MALRDTSSALAPETLARWRQTIGSWCGVDYDNMDTAAQTELNRLIDEAHDWVSSNHGHQTWAQRVWTVGGSDFTAPSTSTGLFTLPSDCRHIVSLQESEDGTGAAGQITTMVDWMAAGAGETSHPWDNQNTPRYFFKAMSDANPPVETWQRQPIPSSAITAMTIVGRPFFEPLGTSGSSQYPGIPPQYTPQLRHHLRAQWAAFTQEYEKVGIETQLRDDAVRSVQINDAPFGAEQPMSLEPPIEFEQELWEN